MTVYRIGEFSARSEKIKEMLDFLNSILPLIQSSQGCESVQLYQSQDEPAKFTMIEVWDSVESHRASVRNIPSELLAQIQPLLAVAPSGAYFKLITQR